MILLAFQSIEKSTHRIEGLIALSIQMYFTHRFLAQVLSSFAGTVLDALRLLETGFYENIWLRPADSLKNPVSDHPCDRPNE
ncbi:hypothetical protein QUA35_06945 [Microcoleus sp. N9_B2]